VRVDDSAFGQIVAAESGRLARLATLLTGDPARGRDLAEAALARAMLGWRRLYEEEPGGALRRVLFDVYSEWWHRGYRHYPQPANGQAEGGPDGADGADGAAQPDDPWAAELAGMTPRQRAVALMDAEGRSEPEMVELLGLSDRAVARARPAVPMPELAVALTTVEDPVPVQAVTARAARIRRRRRLTGWVVLALAVLLAVPVLRVLGGGPDPAEAARQCPTRLPTVVSNTGNDLTDQIVPFTPSRAYLCRFGSDGARSDARLLGSGIAVQFVAAINASRPASTSEVCGQEAATPFVLRLLSGDRSLTVLATPSGCGRVSNGTRTVSAGRDVLARILLGQAGGGPEPALLSCAGLNREVHNDGAGLAERLIGFTGDRIVVCPQGGAATVGELAGQDAREMAAALDSAPAGKAPGTGCPSTQRLIVVVTGLVERVDLAVDAGGCGWATNGTRVVTLDTDTRNALRELAQLPPR
jgi:DNA-directed RNA polymerase specialized sigma24 family protein